MNRRRFIQGSAAVATLLTLVGCDNATIATFVNTIAKYAAQLATYFGSGAIAGQITSLAATIATDITNWESGSASTDAIEALNDLADLVNQIPFLGTYSIFIDLILGAISGLLALLPASATATVQLSVREHTDKLAAMGITRRTVPPFPYKGFDKKTMSVASENFVAVWSRLEVTVGPTVK